jgi:LacI family transcriptional regulator, galactose operon repressor
MTRSTTDMEAIARKAGVSRTTVFNVLRGTGRASAKTRERVLAMARKMGYRPNLLASGLRTKRSRTLGFINTFAGSQYHAKVFVGIDHVVGERGYSILVGNSAYQYDKEEALVDLLLSRAVEGLIVLPIDCQRNASLFARLTEEGVPLLLLRRQVAEVKADLVAIDDRAGGYEAGRHLVGLGRQRIAFVLPRNPHRQYRWAHDRLEGLNQALDEAGLAPATVLGPAVPDFVQAPEPFGFQAVSAHLDSRRRVDGIFAANDNLCYGALLALQQRGLGVPDDVALVGFDDNTFTKRTCPSLTTLVADPEQMGEAAGRLLLRRLDQPKAAIQRRLLEPMLLIRESTGGQRPDETVAAEPKAAVPLPDTG